MSYIGYMLLKLGLLAVAAFIYGLLRALSKSR